MAGETDAAVPAAVGLMYVLMIPMLLLGSVAWLSAESSGLLAVLLLLGAEAFASQTASQYADLPLAFYILATVALLAAAERGGGPPALVIAGMMASFAAWTKNEGLVFWILTTLYVLWGLRGPALIHYLAGTLPGILLTFWFKVAIAPANDSPIAGTIQDAVTKLTDFSRWTEVLMSTVSTLASLSYPWAHPLLLAAALIWALGTITERRQSTARLMLLPLSMLVADTIVYLLTTSELKWHLSTSHSRLIQQIYPALLLCLFLMVRAPVTLPAIEPRAQEKAKKLRLK